MRKRMGFKSKASWSTIFLLWYWQTIKSFPGLWVGKLCSSRLALSSPPPLGPRRQACMGHINRLLGPLSSGWGQPSRRLERKEWFETFIPLAPSNGTMLGWLHPSLSTRLSSPVLYYLLSPLAPPDPGVVTAPMLPGLGAALYFVNSSVTKLSETLLMSGPH